MSDLPGQFGAESRASRGAGESDAALIEQAMMRERIINARRIAALRMGVLALFIAYDVIAVRIVHSDVWTAVQWVTLGYFLLALLILLHTRRSERAARRWSAAIPVVDMPMVFVIAILDQVNYDSAYLVMVYGYQALALCVLIALSMLTMSRRPIMLGMAIAVFLNVLLGVLMKIDGAVIVLTPLYLISVGAICAYARDRLFHLARDTGEQQMRRNRLRRFFSPTIAMVLENSADPSRASTHEVTVLFADLRGFTALSGRLTEGEVVEMLNEFQTRMAACVFGHRGTLDKFMGDGLMAYFGAPLEQPDHADRALACACAMQEALAAMNADFELARANPLGMGIGLHTGRVTLGAIGPPDRRDYTIIGEVVNIASRIESATKDLESPVLVSRRTVERLSDPVRVTLVAEIPLRGVQHPLGLYRPAPPHDQPSLRSDATCAVDRAQAPRL